MNTLKVAESVARKVRELEPHIHILQYHSKAFDSIYIKFDFGVANSLRIADHLSKKTHLDYRYNVILDLDKSYSVQGERYSKNYYCVSDLDKLVQAIVDRRRQKKAQFKDRYEYFMDVNEIELPDSWSRAVEI